jgi:RHH-type proline utilization regulon transcriptional repressor/proline dehydrogenase/delta 1-pyrroline-5-carboxylate dehydrogenase
MGKSAFGPGIKAGGPNYVAQLMTFSARNESEAQLSKSRSSRNLTNERGEDVTDSSLAVASGYDFSNHADSLDNPFLEKLSKDLRQSAIGGEQDTAELLRAIASYDRAAEQEFLRQHDHFRLIGQDNFRRYQPIHPICVRVDPRDSWSDIVLRAAATKAVGGRCLISTAPGVHPKWVQLLHDLTESWAGDIEFLEQSDDELTEMIEWGGVARIRYAEASRVPMQVRRAVVGRFIHIADAPVLSVGRIELLWYVQEQSISRDYHRYGNLGSRAAEPRKPTL